MESRTRGPGATSLTWVILANISHINTCKVSFLYSGPKYSGTMTLTTWFWLDHLTSKFELFWLSGFLKRFSKTSPLKQMKKCSTLLWPLIAPRTMDSALPELLWYCGSWEENIEMTLPYFCTLVIIPPLKRTSTFIWINLNSHHARNVCSKFDWNWEDVSF
jgi:hypothetical protein